MSTNRKLAFAIGALGATAAWALAGRVLPHGLPAGIIAMGLVFGSLHALVAVGVVLTYRATRVVNFAQAELGVVAAIIAIELKLHLGVSWIIALCVALIVGAGVGAAIDLLVMRRLAKAPRLLATVATIGIGQIFSGLAVLIPLALPEAQGFNTFRAPVGLRIALGPIVLTGDHLMVLILAPVTIVALALFLRKTDYGLAMRAAADNGDRAFLLGIPVRRVAALGWAIAGALSALAIMLRAPVVFFQDFSSISAGGPSLLLITLAAAVVGKMENLWQTAAAAIGLGVLAQLASWTFSSTAIMDAIVVGAILIVLLIRGRTSFSRFADTALGAWQAVRAVRPIPNELRRLPEVRVARAAWLGAPLILLVVLPVLVGPPQLEAAGLIAIAALLAVSLVILTGWAGQISLGHFALAGVGSAITGVLLQRHGWDLLAALAAGVLGAATISVIIGLPALRSRGPFLAVTTLGVAVVGYVYLFDARYFPWLVQRHITRPMLLGRFAFEHDWQMYYVALAFLALGIALARRLRRTRLGRAMRAVRDNEDAASAVGIDAVRVKLQAFALSGGLAGLAGGLYVLHQFGIDVEAFSPDVSVGVFAMSVIGGLGSIPGAVMGAVYVRGADLFLSGGWTMLATGAGLLLLLMVMPGGLGEAMYRVRDSFLRRVATRRGIESASLAGIHDRDVHLRAAPDQQVTDSLLRCRGLNVSRGNVQILFDVNLDVAEGEMLAILGPNGSGKSTLLNAISGLIEPTSGRIELNGYGITGGGAKTHGIATAPGGRGIFPTLTIVENLRAAGWSLRDSSTERNAAIENAFERFPELRKRANEPAGNLSGGEQHMLTIAQALLSTPRVLLIDELTLGLSPSAAARLLQMIRKINASGTTILFVEQSLPVAMQLARRAVFLEKGTVRYAGSTRHLKDRPDLVRAVYLPTVEPTAERTLGRPVLKASSLRKRYGGVAAVDDVALTLHDGEILGVIGPNGAGKTTLLDILSGLVEADGGEVILLPNDLSRLTMHQRARHGLARSFQDARLWPSLTVEEALATALERHVRIKAMFPSLFRIPSVMASESEITVRVNQVIEELGLESLRNKFVSELSTGSRRLVDLASVIAQSPRVVLLDEPSAGLAHAEAEALGPMLRLVQQRTGCSMIIVEHHISLLTSVSDTMIALNQGRVIARGSPSEVLASPTVKEAYLGPDRPKVAASGCSGRSRREATSVGRTAGRIAPPTRRS